MSVPTDDELDAAAQWIAKRLTFLLDSIPDDQAFTAITVNDRGRFGEGGLVRKSQSDKGLEPSGNGRESVLADSRFGGGSGPRSVEVAAGKATALTNIGRWYSYE